MKRAPLLFLNVFVIATCGLIYELLAGTLSSYVLGDSVTQFSIIIGVYLFAMGVGSWLSRFIDKNVAEKFVEIELAVEKNPSVAENQVAEATVWLKGHTLRAREATRDMKASIDELTEKLVRQIREDRDKKVSKRHIDKHAHDDGPVRDGPVRDGQV